ALLRYAAPPILARASMNLFFKPRPAIPDVTHIDIDGARVAVTVKVSARARSYRLSLPPGRPPLLTLPAHGRWREAEAFLERQRHWLAARIKRAPEAAPFADGGTVPLRGVPHRIVATGQVRGR